MKLAVKDINGQNQGELELGFTPIEDGRGTQAVHDAVVAYRAAQRSGTACTKTMGEVAGTGRKPWRQKGTGRARAGSFRSPLWRGGGVVFGPKPRDYRKKVGKNTKRLAIRKAFSERLKAEEVVLVDQLALEASKTRELINILTKLGLDGGTLLVVTGEKDEKMMLASRNLRWVKVATGREVNPYQLLEPDKLLFTKSGLEAFQKRLA